MLKTIVLVALIAAPVTGLARNVNLPKTETKAEKPMKACCQNRNHENDAAHSHGHAHAHGEGKACCMKQKGQSCGGGNYANNESSEKKACCEGGSCSMKH